MVPPLSLDYLSFILAPGCGPAIRQRKLLQGDSISEKDEFTSTLAHTDAPGRQGFKYVSHLCQLTTTESSLSKALAN